jgi:HEAT repeat protein
MAAGAGLMVLIVVGITAWPVTYKGRTVNGWLLLANSDDHQERNSADAAFKSLGARAVPDLIAALRARETFLHRARVWISQSILRRDPQVLPATQRRVLAAAALAKLGPVASPAAPQLVASLADRDWQVVANSAEALRRIGVAVTTDVVRALRSPHWGTRMQAITLLGNSPFDTETNQWLAALAVATSDRESPVRAAAIWALGITHDPRYVARIEAGVSDTDIGVRRAALESLGRLGPLAASAAPSLRTALKDQNYSVRVNAAHALWRVTGDADEALPVLQRELTDSDGSCEAALRIRDMGRAAESAIPALLARLGSEAVHRPSRTPSPTAMALGSVGPAAVPGLIELLGHERAEAGPSRGTRRTQVARAGGSSRCGSPDHRRPGVGRDWFRCGTRFGASGPTEPRVNGISAIGGTGSPSADQTRDGHRR